MIKINRFHRTTPLFLALLIFLLFTSSSYAYTDNFNDCSVIDWTLNGAWTTSSTNGFDGSCYAGSTRSGSAGENNATYSVSGDWVYWETDFNLSTTATSYSNYLIWDFVDNGTASNYFQVKANGALGGIGFTYVDVSINKNTWYKLTVTKSSSNYVVNLYYKNGTIKNTQTVPITTEVTGSTKTMLSVVAGGTTAVSGYFDNLRYLTYSPSDNLDTYWVMSDKQSYSNCNTVVNLAYNAPTDGTSVIDVVGYTTSARTGSFADEIQMFEVSGVGDYVVYPSSTVNTSLYWVARLIQNYIYSNYSVIATANFTIVNSSCTVNIDLPPSGYNTSTNYIYNQTTSWNTTINNYSTLANGSDYGSLIGNGSGYGIAGLTKYINDVNDSFNSVNYTNSSLILLTVAPTFFNSLPMKVQALFLYYLTWQLIFIILFGRK